MRASSASPFPPDVVVGRSTYSTPFAKLCKEAFFARSEANDTNRWVSGFAVIRFIHFSLDGTLQSKTLLWICPCRSIHHVFIQYTSSYSDEQMPHVQCLFCYVRTHVRQVLFCRHHIYCLVILPVRWRSRRSRVTHHSQLLLDSPVHALRSVSR